MLYNKELLNMHSKHFTVQDMLRNELAERLEIDNEPRNEKDVHNMINLLSCLDTVWDDFAKTLSDEERKGFALKIVCGYMTQELCDITGVSAEHWHMTGAAAHITTGSRDMNRRLFDWLSLPRTKRKHHYNSIINQSGDYSYIHYEESWNTELNVKKTFR